MPAFHTYQPPLELHAPTVVRASKGRAAKGRASEDWHEMPVPLQVRDVPWLLRMLASHFKSGPSWRVLYRKMQDGPWDSPIPRAGSWLWSSGSRTLMIDIYGKTRTRGGRTIRRKGDIEFSFRGVLPGTTLQMKGERASLEHYKASGRRADELLQAMGEILPTLPGRRRKPERR